MPECIHPAAYPVEDFLSPGNLELADAVVVEVFQLMFGYDVAQCEIPPSTLDDRTAIVGFSGSMRGSCQIRMTSNSARNIAGAMLGSPIDKGDDDSTNDALGELCNMLAGGWKNGVHGLSSQCTLSPPTVVYGKDYKVHPSKPSLKLCRAYIFGAHSLHLTLNLEEAAPARDR